ncbi:hypothetical protein KFE25_011281 [Diacronema lutheri]|uniref:FHA domain-containing protein n=1 Tax=Diacronema lutheri TaxID=2081491 RepID=A0A8J5X3I5_DIALT|nr:hypothetical protein KFE25_011281 [Diacronema lutheri]
MVAGVLAPLVALDAKALSEAECAMTVDDYLKAECSKRTRQLVARMEEHVGAFERQAKRARAALEDAATAAAVPAQEDDEREGTAASEEGGDVPCLLGIKGPYAGETFWMPSAPNTTTRLVIGRAQACDISLCKDDEVSSKHARVDVRNDTFKLVDTNSTNGTFVNLGKLGRKAHVLRPGDTVTLGASTFKWAVVPQP